MPGNAVYISERDLEDVARLVWAEDTGYNHQDDELAWVALAHVIRTRTAKGWRGEHTAGEIIRQSMQFEPMRTASGKERMRNIPPEKLEQIKGIVAGVFAGEIADPTGGADHFLSVNVQEDREGGLPDWYVDLSKKTYTVSVGANTFTGGDASRVGQVSLSPQSAQRNVPSTALSDAVRAISSSLAAKGPSEGVAGAAASLSAAKAFANDPRKYANEWLRDALLSPSDVNTDLSPFAGDVVIGEGGAQISLDDVVNFAPSPVDPADPAAESPVYSRSPAQVAYAAHEQLEKAAQELDVTDEALAEGGVDIAKLNAERGVVDPNTLGMGELDRGLNNGTYVVHADGTLRAPTKAFIGEESEKALGIITQVDASRVITGEAALDMHQQLNDVLKAAGLDDPALAARGIDVEALNAERGVVDPALLDAGDKKMGLDNGTLVQGDDGALIDPSKASIGSESKKALGVVQDVLDDPKKQLEIREQQLTPEQQQEWDETKRELQRAGAAAGMTEDDITFLLLAAIGAMLTGNTQLYDQIMKAFDGKGQSSGQEGPYTQAAYGPSSGTRSGSRSAYSNDPYVSSRGTSGYDSGMPRDILAGRDMRALGFTNNPNEPYWVALNPQGEAISGNMAFERATPMSTTKMATLLTLADMIKAGELPSDFLEKNASLVHAMIQYSSNDAPVKLAVAASGSHDAFVARMNVMAQERGLEGTQYGSPVGFNQGDSPKLVKQATYSTAYDVALVGYYLNKDHPDIARAYASIGSGHTGQEYNFSALADTVIGKTGTGFGGEGRASANKAWAGVLNSGSSYAVLEATLGEYRAAVDHAASVARQSGGMVALDVTKHRAEIKAEQHAAQAAARAAAAKGDFVGMKWDMKPEDLMFNEEGMALVMVATGEKGAGVQGVPGVFLEIARQPDGSLIVADEYHFISGGRVKKENQENGPLPFLRDHDYDKSNPDVQAKYGLGRFEDKSGNGWIDANNREWGLNITDLSTGVNARVLIDREGNGHFVPYGQRANFAVVGDRDGFFVHAASYISDPDDIEGGSAGCPAMDAKTAARFRDNLIKPNGYSKYKGFTVAPENVLTRNVAAHQEQERQRAEAEAARLAEERVRRQASGELALYNVPTRPADALPGSAVMTDLMNVAGTDRDRAVAREILNGNMPSKLQDLVPVTVRGKGKDRLNYELTYYVMPDYLAVGSDTDFVRVPMGLTAAMTVAERFGAVLPSRKMVDQIYAASRNEGGAIAPMPMTPGPQMSSTDYLVRHDRTIDGQTKNMPPGRLISGHKKDLVITNRINDNKDRVAIYGWHRDNGQPIQPLSTVHGTNYADYSHGVRLVSQTAYLNGKPVRLTDIMADPNYAPLISDEGPISHAALAKYGLTPSGISVDARLAAAQIAANDVKPEVRKPDENAAAANLPPVIVIDSGHRHSSFDSVISAGGKKITDFGGTDGEYKANVAQALALGKSFEAKGFEVVYTMHDKYGENHRNPDTKFDARHAVVHQLLAEGRQVAGYFAVHHDGSTDQSRHGTAVAMHPGNLPQTLQAGIAVADSVAAYAASHGIPVIQYDRNAPATAVKSTDASAHADWGDHLTWHRSSYIQPESAGKFIYGQTAGATDSSKTASGRFWDVTMPIPNHVPAMLLEVDFLTNDRGGALANDPKARADYAEAVATGFANYYASTRDRGNERLIGGADDATPTKLPELDLYSGDLGGDVYTGSMGDDSITGSAGYDELLFAGKTTAMVGAATGAGSKSNFVNSEAIQDTLHAVLDFARAQMAAMRAQMEQVEETKRRTDVADAQAAALAAANGVRDKVANSEPSSARAGVGGNDTVAAAAAGAKDAGISGGDGDDSGQTPESGLSAQAQAAALAAIKNLPRTAAI